MNPDRAVLGQALGLALALGVLTASRAPWALDLAIGVLAALAAVELFLITHYVIANRRGPDACRRRPRRRVLDRWALTESAFVLAVPAAVAVARHGSETGAPLNVQELATAAAGASVILAVVFASSLVDWFYVLPKRDGLVRLPPCQTGRASVWMRVTKTWLRHRLVAEATFALTLPLTVIAVFFQLAERFPEAGGLIVRLLGVVAFVVNHFVLKNAWQKVVTGARALTHGRLPFAIGQSVRWREPDKTTEVHVGRLAGLKRAHGQREIWVGTLRWTTSLDDGTSGEGFVLDVSLGPSTIARVGSTTPNLHGNYDHVTPATRQLLDPRSVVRAEALDLCGRRKACLRVIPDCHRVETVSDGTQAAPRTRRTPG